MTFMHAPSALTDRKGLGIPNVSARALLQKEIILTVTKDG